LDGGGGGGGGGGDDDDDDDESLSVFLRSENCDIMMKYC
jgi:hypothetical protein